MFTGLHSEGTSSGTLGTEGLRQRIVPIMKKRLGFTIIYNGLHHLQHLNFCDFMLKNFDHWVVVEGLARASGSTSWCNNLKIAPRSDDGTHEFMTDLALRFPDKITYYSHGRAWINKDAQVNKAAELLGKVSRDCYLWQIDADEHWTDEKLKQAELFADTSVSQGFSFQFNHFVGENMVAKGSWGDGYLNRLWKWRGEKFARHEPALLIGQRKCEPVPDIRYDHYSYYFPKDVLFKSLYYKGHEKIYNNWIELHKLLKSGRAKLPLPISALFGLHTPIGKSKSTLCYLTPQIAAPMVAADQEPNVHALA